MPEPGVDTFIVDESLGGSGALSTHSIFLLDPVGPAVAVRKTTPDTGDVAVDNMLRVLFMEGGRSVYLAGIGDGTTKPTPAAAIASLPAGPGQVLAPSLVASADHIAVANAAWPRNKVSLLNGPSTGTVAQYVTLAGAVRTGAGGLAGGGRGAGIWAGLVTYRAAGGGTFNVPLAVSVAGRIARNDRVMRNPNVAAAGRNGELQAVGLSQIGAAGATVYTRAELEQLYAAQVNTAALVSTRDGVKVRNYGFRTIADLTVLEHWWDFNGARTIMDFRARATVVDEEVMFDQWDGQRIALGRYNGLLRGEAADLYRIGALHGATPGEAYDVDTSDAVNSDDDLALGDVVAVCKLKVSPHFDHVTTRIIRRPTTAAEL